VILFLICIIKFSTACTCRFSFIFWVKKAFIVDWCSFVADCNLVRHVTRPPADGEAEMARCSGLRCPMEVEGGTEDLLESYGRAGIYRWSALRALVQYY